MQQKVIVIGAGMAGLAATYALRGRGLEVALLEAAPHPGGRVTQKEIQGFHIALGANLFLETFDTARQLAQELHVPLRRTPVPVHSGIYRNGRFHGLYGGSRPDHLLKTAHTFLSFRLLSPKGLRQTIRLARMLRARGDDLSFDDPSRMLDLDTGESAAEFFESNIGTEALDRLFGPGLSGYTFAHPEQVGAAYAMATVWHTGLNGVAWPCLPEGGIGTFVDALVHGCGTSLRLSTPVHRIVIEDGTVQGVITAGGFMKCDALICATTATAALEIAPQLPPGIAEVLRGVTYSRCCRVFFGVDSSPLPRDWYAAGFPRQADTFLTGVSNAAVLAPETVPPGKAIIDVLVIDRQADELSALDDDTACERVLSEIRSYFPAMSATPRFAFVHRWREAVSLAPGGTMTAVDGLRRNRFAGIRGLVLAGDYMGVPSANGALRSGLDAAEAVLESAAHRACV